MTRMWMVDTRVLCRQHLLGEHKEIHQLVGSLLYGHNMRGRADAGQIECRSIQDRHEELVQELQRRGYNHHSPLPSYPDTDLGEVDREASLTELLRRCPRCYARYITS